MRKTRAIETEGRLDQIPLVFFYSGERLPGYCFKAMRHAVSVWHHNVVLLTDTPTSRVPRGIRIVDYRPWFESQALEATVARNKIDAEFRSGFWSATLKRFFVLHQYMELMDLEKVVHAELDSVIFASYEELVSQHLPNPALLVPWNPPHKAIGSLVIVNGRQGIRNLVRFATNDKGFSNEMELLTSFLLDPTELGFGLPTVDALMYPQEKPPKVPNLLTEDQVGMRFDSARLGQWVFGVDPRNVSDLFSKNHFAEPGLAPVKVMNHRKSRKPIILVTNSEIPTNIANLHVHSKRISQATMPIQRALWFAIANLPFTTVVGLNTSKLKKRFSHAFGLRRDKAFRVLRGILRKVRR